MSQVNQSSPYTSVPAGTSSSFTGSVLDNGAARAFHGIIVVTSAGVSAGTVVLEVSHDNVNWFTTAASVSTTSANAVLSATVVNFPAQYVRARVSVGITGGTVTATVASA